MVEATGNRVEPGGVNDHVEFVFGVAGLDSRGRDALDRRLVDVDELDVGLVVDLVVTGLERDAAGAEAVVFRDQLLRHRRVLDPLTNPSRDEAGDQRVRLAIDQYVAKIALPDAEAGLAVEFFPESLALLRRHLESGAGVGGVDEAAGGLGAAPVRSTLEHGQVADGLGHFLDRLYRGGAGADHRDPLAVETDRFLGPVMGVAGRPLKVSTPAMRGMVGAESTPMAVIRRRAQ
jgi:hypothetical protein